MIGSVLVSGYLSTAYATSYDDNTYSYLICLSTIYYSLLDHKFSVYTPSLIASGSVGAAVIGLPCHKEMGIRFREGILYKLQQITQIDPVINTLISFLD